MRIIGKTIQARVVIMATLMVGLLIAGGWFMTTQARLVSEAEEDVRRSISVSSPAADVALAHAEVNVALLRYVIFPDQSFQRAIDVATAERGRLISELKAGAYTAELRAVVDEYEEVLLDSGRQRDAIVAAMAAGVERETVDEMVNTRYELQVNVVKPLLDQILEVARVTREEALARSNAAVQRQLTVLTYALPAFVLGIVLLFILLYRGIVRPLSRAANDIGDTSLKLAASSQQTSAAAQQNVSVAQQIAAGAVQQSQQSETVSKSAMEMASAVQQMSASVQEAAADAQNSSKLAQSAGATAEGINALVTTIGSIAEQTNMLALNAAIEAARAGEAGRGFTVVADEVRKLAENSGTAAKEVRGIVDDVLGRVRETIKGINDVAKRITEVSAAAQQEASSIQSIAKTMGAISAVAQQNAAGVQQLSSSNQQVSAANQEVAAAATQMQRLAEELLDMVSGASARRMAARESAYASRHGSAVTQQPSAQQRRAESRPSRNAAGKGGSGK